MYASSELYCSASLQSTGPTLFSPKLIPWFVSDVTPADFRLAITSLLDQSFFNAAGASDSTPPVGQEHLKRMVTRWKAYIDEGVFSLSVSMNTVLGGDRGSMAVPAEFWTSPWPYWQMEDLAHELFQSLVESDLVVFKVGEITDIDSIELTKW